MRLPRRGAPLQASLLPCRAAPGCADRTWSNNPTERKPHARRRTRNTHRTLNRQQRLLNNTHKSTTAALAARPSRTQFQLTEFLLIFNIRAEYVANMSIHNHGDLLSNSNHAFVWKRFFQINS